MTMGDREQAVSVPGSVITIDDCWLGGSVHVRFGVRGGSVFDLETPGLIAGPDQHRPLRVSTVRLYRSELGAEPDLTHGHV